MEKRVCHQNKIIWSLDDYNWTLHVPVNNLYGPIAFLIQKGYLIKC